jgi:hypothetical protein
MRTQVVPYGDEEVREGGPEEHLPELRDKPHANAGGEPRAEVLHPAHHWTAPSLGRCSETNSFRAQADLHADSRLAAARIPSAILPWIPLIPSDAFGFPASRVSAGSLEVSAGVSC